MHVKWMFGFGCNVIYFSVGTVVDVSIMMLSWVECVMFQLVNEGEYGMHNNNLLSGMIKCVHCDVRPEDFK